MADGVLSIELSDLAADALTAKAEILGVAPAELAALLLDERLLDQADLIWSDGDPRQDHAANYDLDESGRAWSDIRPEMIARLERKLGERE